MLDTKKIIEEGTLSTISDGIRDVASQNVS